MGDTVVFEDEVNAALDAALTSGIEVTALHNHFLFDKPKAYFMHIGGNGSSEELAAGVRSIWDAVKSVRAKNPTPAELFPGQIPRDGELDTARLEETIGVSGKFREASSRSASAAPPAWRARPSVRRWGLARGWRFLAPTPSRLSPETLR